MKKKLVLLVEDQKYIRKIVQFNLKKSGFEVIEAENGKAGYEIAKQEQPDLILLDLMMPILNGFETLKILKSDDTTRKIPVFILSAITQKGDILKAIDLGAVDYISKPFKIEVALQKIKKLFETLAVIDKKKSMDTFPVFFKNTILIIQSPNEEINIDFIKKMLNSVSKSKEDINEIIIDFSKNEKIELSKVPLFDKIFSKLTELNKKIKIISGSVQKELIFKKLTLKFPIFRNLEDSLPPDIKISELSNLKKLNVENIKFNFPVHFRDGNPVIDFLNIPKIEKIDDLEKDINQLVDYSKTVITINFHSLKTIPSRYAGILVKNQTTLQTKHSGEIKLIIKSPELIKEFKEGGFLSKFKVFDSEIEAVC